MKKIKNLAMLMALLCGLVFTSCSKDYEATVEEQEAAIAPIGIPQEIFEKAQSLHFNTFDIQKTTFEKPNGKV